MMNRTNCPVFFFILFISVSLFGIEKVPFQSEQPYGIYAALEEPLHTEKLASLFLLASDTKEDDASYYLALIDRIGRDIAAVMPVEGDRNERAEFILQYLHDKILRRYSLTQTRLDVLLDGGDYNCVSSAVLYMLLCRRFAIPVGGIQTKDHAFCIVSPNLSPEFRVDVETTNEWGFDPGSRKEFESSFSDSTGFAYVEPGNYKERISLGDREMAGLILQNRIVELQKKNRHMDALVLAADRYVLTRTEMTLADYYDAVQNGAASLNSKKRYDEAVKLIIMVEEETGSIPAFLEHTRSQILFNACADAVNRHDLEDASRILGDYNSYFQTAERDEMERLISTRRLEKLVKEPFSEDIVSRIKDAADNGYIDQSRAASLAAYHFAIEAEIISRDLSNLTALSFLEEVPSWIKKDREYRRIYGIVKDNAAIEYHNRIVRLINDSRLEEASILLDEALENIPDSGLLKRDKAALSR